MTRVVGHTGAVASPLQSLSGAGVVGRTDGSGPSVFDGGGLLVGIHSLYSVANRPAGFSATKDISGFDFAPHPLGGYYLFVLQGTGLFLLRMVDLTNFANPANTFLQSTVIGSDGFLRVTADGTKLFCSSSTSPGIYTMSTPFDLTTLTFHSAGIYADRGSLSPDGTYYAALHNDDQQVLLYTPPTPWDLTNSGGLRYVATGFDFDNGSHTRRIDFISDDTFMVCHAPASGPLTIGGYPTFQIIKSGFSYSLEFKGMFAPIEVTGAFLDQGPRFVEGFGMFLPSMLNLYQFN